MEVDCFSGCSSVSANNVEVGKSEHTVPKVRQVRLERHVRGHRPAHLDWHIQRERVAGIDGRIDRLPDDSGAVR
jgi:hypothetical protein